RLVSSLTRSRIGWSSTAAGAASVADVVGSGMLCSLAAAGHSVADFAQGRQEDGSGSFRLLVATQVVQHTVVGSLAGLEPGRPTPFSAIGRDAGAPLGGHLPVEA